MGPGVLQVPRIVRKLSAYKMLASGTEVCQVPNYLSIYEFLTKDSVCQLKKSLGFTDLFVSYLNVLLFLQLFVLASVLLKMLTIIGLAAIILASFG